MFDVAEPSWTSYGKLPFDWTFWGLWLWRMIICREGGHELDNGIQLSIFTFTCGSHEIRPRRSFWITVWVRQVDSMEDKLSIESLDAFWGRVGAQNERSQRARLPRWSSWSWKLEEMRTEGDEMFCDVCAIRLCRNITQSRIPYHRLWLTATVFSQLYADRGCAQSNRGEWF